MTPAEQAFWRRVQARINRYTPNIAVEIRRALDTLRTGFSEAEFTRLLNERGLEATLDQMFSAKTTDEAFLAIKEQLRETVRDAGSYFTKDIPQLSQTNLKSGTFDTLNPKVIEAINKLDTRVTKTLSDDIRETVRQRVRAGLERGETVAQIAKDLRGVIGLAPNQEKEIQNYREELEGTRKGNPLDRKLRNTRYDKRTDAGTLTPEQIDKAVASYRDRRINQNAVTNASTAAKDATKLANRLARQSAIDRGILDGSRQRRKWIAVGGPAGDGRNRPEHLRMHGEDVPYDQPYSNGQMVAGEGDWECRCIDRYYQAKTEPSDVAA